MIDQRFHQSISAIALSELAIIAKANLSDEKYADISISSIATLQEAKAGDISFLDNKKYSQHLQNCGASAVIIRPDMLEYSRIPALISENPYLSYALIAQKLYPFAANVSYIHPSAIIEDGVQIGLGCHIGAGVFIGKNTIIGNNCAIHAGCSVQFSIIGDNVIIHPNCSIGQDGFGFASDMNGHHKIPQLGRVIIENNVEIGANSCIDRGSLGDTVIGEGTKIDNLVQIGHNVKIGRNCLIVAQVGIAGSTILEDFVIAGGQAGFAGHLHIGKGSRFAAQSGIASNVEAGITMGGSPAVPERLWKKQAIALKRLVQKK